MLSYKQELDLLRRSMVGEMAAAMAFLESAMLLIGEGNTEAYDLTAAQKQLYSVVLQAQVMRDRIARFLDRQRDDEASMFS